MPKTGRSILADSVYVKRSPNLYSSLQKGLIRGGTCAINDRAAELASQIPHTRITAARIVQSKAKIAEDITKVTYRLVSPHE